MAVNSLFAKITLLKKPANWTHLGIMMDLGEFFPGKVIRIRMNSRDSLYNAPGKKVFNR